MWGCEGGGGDGVWGLGARGGRGGGGGRLGSGWGLWVFTDAAGSAERE